MSPVDGLLLESASLWHTSWWLHSCFDSTLVISWSNFIGQCVFAGWPWNAASSFFFLATRTHAAGFQSTFPSGLWSQSSVLRELSEGALASDWVWRGPEKTGSERGSLSHLCAPVQRRDACFRLCSIWLISWCTAACAWMLRGGKWKRTNSTGSTWKGPQGDCRIILSSFPPTVVRFSVMILIMWWYFWVS